MKTMKWLSLLLALCLLAACIPSVTAEEQEIILAAPVDEEVEETETAKLWSEEIAKAVEEAEAAAAEAALAAKDAVPIDDEHFPDDTFRGIVGGEGIDTDRDGELSEAERNAVTELILFARDPYDAYGDSNRYHFDTLQGVEYFPNVEKLDCHDTGLPELDLSHNPALKTLICDRNQIYRLNVSGCPALEYLDCWSNTLHSLDVSHNPALMTLSCGDNSLGALDVSHNPALETLSCRRNPLTTLDVSHNPALASLDCNYCASLTQLDVSHNPALASLNLIFSGVVNLNLSGCSSLTSLNATNNSLGELDVTGCPNLEMLDVRYGTMTRLDATGCSRLENVYCFHNRLTSLIVDGCESILRLHCYGNALTELDVTSCPRVMRGIQNGVNHGTVDGLEVDYYNSGEYTVLKVDAAVELNPVRPTPPPDSIPIVDCKITGIKAQTYTGSAIKPKPVVKYNGETLIEDVDYKVTYKNNKKVGKATVTIEGINAYAGTVKKTFKILPKKVALTKLTAGKGKLAVQWKKSAGAGYQIQYGLKKNFSGAKTVTITKSGTVKKVLKKLKSGKVYYVRIRGYKKVGGKEYVSKWSKAKKAKVK